MTKRETPLERCLNCGGTVGSLETPYLWQDNIVCVDCYNRLKRIELDRSSPAPRGITQPQNLQAAHASTAGCPICGQAASVSPDGKSVSCRACRRVFETDGPQTYDDDYLTPSDVVGETGHLMPLVCPCCGGRIKVSRSATQLKCDHCGTELLVRTGIGGRLTLEPLIFELREIRKEIVASREDKTARRAFDCPKCHSDDVKKVSLLFESGTQRIQASSLHLAGGIFAPDVATTTTTGTQQSQLARRLAPPTARPTVTPIIVSIFVGPILGFALEFAAGPDAMAGYLWLVPAAVCFAIGALVGIKNARWNTNELPDLHDKWSRQCLCQRCGYLFVPGG